MDYNFETYKLKVIDHYKKNWGNDYRIMQWEGVMKEKFKEFFILEYPPTANREMWTYATCGMSDFEYKKPIELHIFSDSQDNSLSELLTIVSYYHKTEAKLSLNHTVNFGRPWKPNSKCSFGLISLPYLDGPDLEILSVKEVASVSFYWLIPITKDEVEFKKAKGVENLEEKFDNPQFNYLDPLRESIV